MSSSIYLNCCVQIKDLDRTINIYIFICSWPCLRNYLLISFLQTAALLADDFILTFNSMQINTSHFFAIYFPKGTKCWLDITRAQLRIETVHQLRSVLCELHLHLAGVCVCVPLNQGWFLVTAWTCVSSFFLGKIFPKWFVIAPFLVLKVTAWPKVTQLALQD